MKNKFLKLLLVIVLLLSNSFKVQSEEFEKMPYFNNAIKLRKFDELAKKDNIKIKNIDEYKKLLNSQLL